MVTIELDDEEAKKLLRRLDQVEDCGPDGEGWQSDELEELCNMIRDGLSQAQLNKA